MVVNYSDQGALISAQSEDEQRAIKEVETLLARLHEERKRQGDKVNSHPPRARLEGADGDVIELPPSIYEVIKRIIPLLKRGDAVALVPYQQKLTTQEAADFLNMSRQFLVTLLERGEIPFEKVGTHRRVRFHALVDYKERRRIERQKSLAAITALSEESGEYS